MTLQLRPYQRESLDALSTYWQDGGGNGLIVLPTGAGKSLVIATLVRELLTSWPDLRIGIITHVRELVRQNMEEMIKTWPSAPVGIYAAGLNRRDTRAQVLFGSIQSVFNKADVLGSFDVLIIDEAHLIPRNSETMYGRFIADVRARTPDARLVGLTATPFRLDTGRLDTGKGALFDDVVYEAGVAELIEQGYLSALTSKGTASAIDISGVQIRGGEFVAGSLEEAAMRDGVVKAAVEEMVAFGQGRRAWLAFCSGIEHATAVRDEVRTHGVPCEVVHGEMTAGDRDRIINQFREGSIRCLTSVAVLTTGFNVPHVDMRAMLRPTLSTGLYVQIVGRGFRTAPGKEDCLILDFAGNVRRHGPVDAVRVKSTAAQRSKDDEDFGEGKVKADTVRAKECPACRTFAALHATKCQNPSCDHEWPLIVEPKHKPRADAEAAILSKNEPQWLQVSGLTFTRHQKLGKPDSVRVEYWCGLTAHREWWCFEHSGFAQQKAGELWRRLGGQHPIPTTTSEALKRQDELHQVTEIRVQPDGDGFYKIVARKSVVRPPPPPKPKKWNDVLGVSRNAERGDIDRAFRELCKSAHPDAGGTNEAMIELNQARSAAIQDIDLRDFR